MLMEKLSPEAITHHAFAIPENETAGPSTSLRSGRDDKLEGGGHLGMGGGGWIESTNHSLHQPKG